MQVSEKWGELLLQEMVLIELAALAWHDADEEAALDYAARARDLAIRLDLQFDRDKMDEMMQAIIGIPAISERDEVRASHEQVYLLAQTNGARGLI